MADIENLRRLLLDWYEKNGRDLPWRFKGGAHPDPYVVLVSEIMLQQTTVKTVIPYFGRFMARFPTLEDLARAPLEEVYLYWQGLGYYTRAKSLHHTAMEIVEKYQGKFPSKRDEVARLKGLGPYTIASFLALAFDLPETVVDGNVLRIFSRLNHLTAPLDQIRSDIETKAKMLTDPLHPADYASAIMDLGAMICTPKNPKCALCPWRDFCASVGKADIESIPQRQKLAKKQIEAYVYVIENDAHEILIRLRSEKGLLSGLYEFPWSEEKLDLKSEETKLSVSHIFTHINMRLKICKVHCNEVLGDGFFVSPHDFDQFAFSSLMQKVWKTYLRQRKL